MAEMIKTPNPPYYAAIFSSTHTGQHDGYEVDTQAMIELAQKQPSFLGVEATGDDNLAIAVSYWDNVDAIRQFKALADHLIIQQKGKETYYQNYTMRIAKVERDYTFER